MNLFAWLRNLVDSPKDYLFTPRAKRVLELAKAESVKSGQGVETIGHLAIALLNFNEGVAFNVLTRLQIDRQKLLQLILAEPRSGTLKNLLPVAHIERRRLSHSYLGTEHLLLAIIRHVRNPFVRQLREQGTDLDFLRQEVLNELDPNFDAS